MIIQTALRSGYHTANMDTEIPSGPFEASDVARHHHQTPVTPHATTEMTAVLANLATATGADSAIVAALTKSLAELTDVTKAQAEELRRLIQSGHISPVQTPTQHSSTTVIRGNGHQRRSGANDQGGGVAHFTRPKTITSVGPMATRLDYSILALPAQTVSRVITQQPPNPTSWVATPGDLSSSDEGGRLR
jgi:hypothetical protein